MKQTNLILTLVLAFAFSGSVQSRSIDWGGAVGDSLFESGGAVFGADMVFELGSFGSTFTPDSTNLDQWLANWKVFDRATAGNGWNPTPGEQFFTSIANLETNGTSSESPPLPTYTFNQGEQGYIWVYKTNQTYAEGLEWALMTNNGSDGISGNDWLFPAHSDQTSLPLQWRLSTASTPVFGALNDQQGPGVFTNNPPQIDLQTHTIAPIPEPGSALLLGLGAIPFLRRRRK